MDLEKEKFTLVDCGGIGGCHVKTTTTIAPSNTRQPGPLRDMTKIVVSSGMCRQCHPGHHSEWSFVTIPLVYIIVLCCFTLLLCFQIIMNNMCC